VRAPAATAFVQQLDGASELRSDGPARALMYAIQPWWSGSKAIQRSKIWRAPGTLPSISSMWMYLYLEARPHVRQARPLARSPSPLTLRHGTSSLPARGPSFLVPTSTSRSFLAPTRAPPASAPALCAPTPACETARLFQEQARHMSAAARMQPAWEDSARAGLVADGGRPCARHSCQARRGRAPELVHARQQRHGAVPHVARVVDEAVPHLHLRILEPHAGVGVRYVQRALPDAPRAPEVLLPLLPYRVLRGAGIGWGRQPPPQLMRRAARERSG